MREPCCLDQERTTHPDESCVRLTDRLSRVCAETLQPNDSSGRVLAEPIVSDRDSPPCDVSAMDGYALRVSDAAIETVLVEGEVLMGQRPKPLRPGHAIKIFTGAPIPDGADCVVRREFVNETHLQGDHTVDIPKDAGDLFVGANIRRKAENTQAGTVVCEPGVLITPASISTLAAFGYQRVRVFRRVLVRLLITGNELRDVDSSPEPFAIRDSNGPALIALIERFPWIELVACTRIEDTRSSVMEAAKASLAASDAVICTGGVSMGDHDYVPEVFMELGATIAFHKLPIRPGKPMLGAIGPEGQAVLGLPGNPVSALTTMCRFGINILAARAGFETPPIVPARVQVIGADSKTLPLWWYRPVRRVGADDVELVVTKGSGDLASLANSHGFIEQPRGESRSETATFWSWTP